MFIDKRDYLELHALPALCWGIYLYQRISLSHVTSGAGAEGAEGSISIISTARADWAPSQPPLTEVDDQILGVSIRTKGSRGDDVMDLGKPSQADWIRQYMKQQEEVLRKLFVIVLFCFFFSFWRWYSEYYLIKKQRMQTLTNLYQIKRVQKSWHHLTRPHTKNPNRINVKFFCG